jgi:hypothetical protein
MTSGAMRMADETPHVNQGLCFSLGNKRSIHAIAGRAVFGASVLPREYN